MCACKASILTGRARRGLFETSQNLVAEHLLSVSAPVATYLVVLGARSTACFCRVFLELRMPIFCHHTPPSCCHLHSERSTMHPPRTPAASDRYGARPLTQVPLRRARTRTTTTTTTRYRRTPNVARTVTATHEWRQITRARTSRPDVTTVTVTMTATITATVVVLRVVDAARRGRRARRVMSVTNRRNGI